MNHLLIIGCSQRKVESDKRLAAIDRYDGPTYRCLRKMRREGYTHPNLDCQIVSARFGLISIYNPVPNYDQIMTPQRAEELRESVQYKLAAILELKSDGYDQVFINLGKTYMRTLEGFQWGTIATMEATGGIGLKTQQMKAWLKRIREV